MRVLITTGIYPPDIGGPATYSKILADKLPEYNIDAEILTFGRLKRLPKILKHTIFFFKVLKSALKSDVIFAQDPVSVGFSSAIISKLLGKKFILRVGGDYAWEQGVQRFGVSDLLDDFLRKKHCWRVEILRKVQSIVAKSARVIITPSRYLKNVVCKWNVKPQKVKVVYNAFLCNSKVITKEEAKRTIGINSVIILSAGRLVKWKGFDTLISIMPAVLKEVDAKLIIIGSGPEEKNLKMKIEYLKMQDKILMVGKKSRKEMDLYLRAGDIFVLNSGYEGFSHQILEAMAMEVPIIATKVGGNIEIIKNYENGILIDYNNRAELIREVLNLVKQKELATILTQNAKESLKEYTLKKMLDETVRVLKGVE